MAGNTSLDTKLTLPGGGLRLRLGLLLCLALSSLAWTGWVYWAGRQTVQQLQAPASSAVASQPSSEQPALVPRMEAWAARLAGTSILISLGWSGVLALVWLWGRRRWTRRWQALSRQYQEAQRQVQEAHQEAQRLTRDKQRLAEELHTLTAELEQRIAERTAALERARAALEQELNERKQAEKMLALQSKELERSKGVLELHVQARTAELQKLQRRYESILNSAGEGIYGLDLHGRMVFANPAAAKLTGWQVSEMLGKTEAELFRPTCVDGRPVEGEPPAEQLFHCKDGSTVLVECVRRPLHENERLAGTVVIFKDITERKRTEEALARKAAELARSNAELEQFAFVASHDLQEPLRKIQAFGDRLKSKLDALQLTDGREYLERMQSAAARMQTLINDLLTFSRVISASRPFVPVDLNAVIKGVLSDLEVRIEQTKAVVEVGPLPTVDADPLQMRQLFQNLIGNALKFQPPGNRPVVRIHSQLLQETNAQGEPREVCEIQVQDNGIGFDEKYLDKIFAVFQRLHGRNEYEGTGVGLAVCRRITDRHGGSITARSQPGQGATFIVRLPVRQPGTAPAAETPTGPKLADQPLAA